MRIITWNCNQRAFRNKFEMLSGYNADVYVIQECENPSFSNNKLYQDWAINHLWIGDTKNKGIGIFAKPEIALSKLDWSNQYKDHLVKHFLPCSVNGEFDLLAVWTHKNQSPNFGYIGQFWKYLQINKCHISKALILGDFNSNTIWDQWDRWWNHSDVVNELKEIGIESFYHFFNAEEQGKEKIPTLYFRKNLNSPYHIDYIFGSEYFKNTLRKFEIGQVDPWLRLSDHMPVICDLDL